MKFQTQYSRDPDANAGLGSFEPSVTQQHMADEVLPAKIVERYLRTGSLDPSLARSPVFGDVSLLPRSYEECFEVSASLSKHYNELPSEVQRIYKDPANFIRQTSSDQGMRQLGTLLHSLSLKEPGFSEQKPVDKADKAASVPPDKGAQG